MTTVLQHEQINCSVCHEDFIYGDGETARYFGWQHTKKHGWCCPEHAPKRSKFKNVKTEMDGITFDSQAELRRYCELKLLEMAREIRDLEVHPEYELLPAFKIGGKTERRMVYKADFTYIDCETGKRITEDVKGAKTAVYLLKRKLLLYFNRGLDFREIDV